MAYYDTQFKTKLFDSMIRTYRLSVKIGKFQSRHQESKYLVVFSIQYDLQDYLLLENDLQRVVIVMISGLTFLMVEVLTG